MRLSLNMSLIDTRTHACRRQYSCGCVRLPMILAILLYRTASMTVCDNFCPSFHPGAPARAHAAAVAAVGFPGAFRSFGAGLDQTPVSTPSTPHCQRQPHPPRRTRPLPSPTPSTRRSTPGAAVRVLGRQPSQGCGLVGRRVGRRFQVHDAVRFPPTAPAHAMPPPSRLAARKLQVQLGANLEGRVAGFGCLWGVGPRQVPCGTTCAAPHQRRELHLVEYGPSKTLRVPVSPVWWTTPYCYR